MFEFIIFMMYEHVEHVIQLPRWVLHVHIHPIGIDGSYQYIQDLMRQDAYKGPRETDSRLTLIQTPLNVATWRSKLVHYPDKDFVRYILQGIEHGFGIGVNSLASFEGAKNNMTSAPWSY